MIILLTLWWLLDSPGYDHPRAEATIIGLPAIYDTMQYLDNDIATVALGLSASMGQFLLCAGTPGKRYALPHARIMMHQPSGGIGGIASDIAIQVEQTLHTKRVIQERTAFHTGQTVEQIDRDSDRDRWFTAAEARDYGLVDQVVASARAVPAESPFGYRT